MPALSDTYDAVVIGAGIHGAGAAQALAAAGYSVLVLEQYDEVAQGTSSRSSKLVHGGLRYLEHGQFRLVNECLRERALLLHNASWLVELQPFVIPVYRQTSRRPWKIRLGLAIYTLLSRKGFHSIPERQWSSLDGLKTQDLDAVFSYYDAQTDDARLTRAVMASAMELGVQLQTGARLEQAHVGKGGVELHYTRDGLNNNVKAGLCVNATGAWINETLQKVVHANCGPDQVDIELVQGTHIVIDGEITQSYYLESPTDGRAVFVTPWQGRVMVGTTETAYRGNPADVNPLVEEIDYLLEIYKYYFGAELEAADVVDAFAGLRVLPGGDGAAFKRSRDTYLHLDDNRRPRVISIVGGKLTSYRSTAEKLQIQALKILPHRQPVADTRSLVLPVVA